MPDKRKENVLNSQPASGWLIVLNLTQLKSWGVVDAFYSSEKTLIICKDHILKGDTP